MAASRQPPMAKAYEPSKVEGPLYKLWLDGSYFTPRIDPAKQPFCIIQPPPNVTGELHLGHALTSTIEDCLIRWHRLKGDPSLWLPGLDHAGIATQNVVEKELAKEGISRQDLGREEFLKRVWAWVDKYRHVIDEQHMRLGASCDWDRQRFTMDEGPQRAVRTTFVKLYKEGLIYRGERIINWCPRCQTALSDLEVEHKEQEGHLWYLRYPLLDEDGKAGSDYVVIATTRPETIVADVAVAVNPEVERWRKIVGRKALLPIIEREIPVIADEAVDPEFGTGALKITPGHDPLDFEIGERHGLRPIVAIAADGTINEEAGPYQGMDRFQCRQRIVEELERLGLIERTEPYRYSIGHCERCDSIVEPIASKQWFVRMEPLAKPAIAAVKDGRIKITPRRFARVYLHWMENIRDWCISRQLWWGHRIPIWYCDDCGEQTVALDDPSACQSCRSSKLQQDPDVLDTWFSSGLWPHSTLGWPDDTEDLRYFYPTSVLETGYDILFFWVARMVMMGLYNTGDVPFRHVYLHGLIRDRHGRKMSKSVGNVVDPLVAADKYGTDALRYALATGGTPGNDFRLTDERLEGARNFANKIWNASRFVIQNLEGHEPVAKPQVSNAMPLEDRWILSRTQQTVASVDRLLGSFRMGEAGHRLHDFFWGEFADWYVEMAKVRLTDADGNDGESGRSPLPMLAYVLDTSLRLLHPFLPFVTEAVWQRLRPHIAWAETEALISAPWPKAKQRWIDAEADSEARLVMEVVRAIRNIRTEKKVDPRRYVEAYVASTAARRTIEVARPIVETLARVRPLHLVDGATSLPRDGVVTAVLAQAQVTLPMAGLVDTAGERARLENQLAEAEAEVQRAEARLANPKFRAKAPPPVVARADERLAEARSRLETLRRRLSELT